VRPPVMTLEDAVAGKVRDGASVYLGNFGAQLFAVGHEIIRQGKRDLDVVVASGGLLVDQLLGAGCVGSATFGHCWSPVGPSPAWNFRRLAESGDTSVRISEMSLGMMTAALTAGAWGVPFMPFPGLQDTGFVTEDWTGGRVAHATTPFGDGFVVEAITTDVAFIHVDRCDRDGNGWINGPLGEVPFAAGAATEVVMVAEEIVDWPDVAARGINVPGVLVSAIVEAPGAVAPDGAVGRYDRDVEAYVEYAAAAATREGFADWMRGLSTGGGA
jgi:glutaconate CoA-transferase subunit A